MKPDSQVVHDSLNELVNQKQKQKIPKLLMPFMNCSLLRIIIKKTYIADD